MILSISFVFLSLVFLTAFAVDNSEPAIRLQGVTSRKSSKRLLTQFPLNSSNSTEPSVAASQILDRRLASFSFELAYFPTFAGNLSHPNRLTQELMQRLVERTGVGPDIRPGGITVCVAMYY